MYTYTLISFAIFGCAFAILISKSTSAPFSAPSYVARSCASSSALMPFLAGDREPPPPPPPPLEPPPPPPPPARTDIEYAELKQLLADCRIRDCPVTALEFANTVGSEGVVTVAGARLNVIGIPPDNPSNAAGGPFKLMAALRDANVPYTFPYSDLSKFRNNGPSLPSLPSGLPSLPTPSLPSLSLPSLPF